MRKQILPILVGLAVPLLSGCDDSLGGFLLPVPDSALEATLTDFASGDLQDPSAFDVITFRAVRTDQTSGWDFLFVLDAGQSGEFRPRRLVLEDGSVSGIQLADRSFEEILEAPREGYVTDEPVPVEVGRSYLVRSRQDPNQFGVCFRFLKLEVLSVDRTMRSVTFRFLANLNCNRTTLVPGAGGDG